MGVAFWLGNAVAVGLAANDSCLSHAPVMDWW